MTLATCFLTLSRPSMYCVRRRLFLRTSKLCCALTWRTVRDALASVCDPRDPHTISGHEYRGGARSYPGHTGSELDLPAKTIKAGGHGVPGGENMMRFPDGTVRYSRPSKRREFKRFLMISSLKAGGAKRCGKWATPCLSLWRTDQANRWRTA